MHQVGLGIAHLRNPSKFLENNRSCAKAKEKYPTMMA
jgi:hypothetical protein